ncbi:AAA family ATPase [Candidatus Poribacteria bacterium]|nr:AAA family ATPase [Candidatus Poribacteria bacterium]
MPLIGRKEECSALADMLAGCVRGAGHMATVGGHAGVGKTRLAEELRKHSDRTYGDAVTWLWGSAEAHAPRGFQAVRQALDSYLSRRGLLPEEMDLDDLNAALAKILLDETDLARQEIHNVTETLARFLAGSDETPGSHIASDAEQAKSAVLHALHAFFLGLAWRQPTVLVMDDYHWADTPTAQLAWRLAEVADEAPLFLVALYRPPIDGERGSLLAAGGKLDTRHAALYLEDLDPSSTVELTRSLTRIDPISEALASAVLYRCGGNPLFIEEMLRPLVDGEMTEERLLTTPVPTTVQEAVRRRLVTLPSEARAALDVASVIGPRFSAELLWAVSDDPTRVGSTLGELRRRQLVVEHVSRTRKLFAFRHVLLQEAVYESLPEKDRARIHLAVARALEEGSERDIAEQVGEIGLHYAAADVRDKAVEYLVAAGDRDRALYANESAVEHYERALDTLHRDDEAEQDKERILDLAIRVGDIRARLGDSGMAEARFTESIALARELGWDTEYVGRLIARLGDTQFWQQRKEEARATAREGLRLVGQRVASPARVALLECLCTALQHMPSRAERDDAVDQLEAALVDVPYFGGVAEAYYRVAYAYMYRARRHPALWPKALQCLMKMEAICRQYGDGRGLARCYHGMADLYVAREREPEQAIQFFERSLEQAIYLSDTRLIFEGHLDLAHIIMVGDGPIEQAEEHIQAGVAAMRRLEAATGYVAQAPECFELVGDEYGRRGHYAQATEFWIRSVNCGASAFLHRRLLMKLEWRYIAEGRHDEFPALCRELWHKIESAPGSALCHPYLSPAEPSPVFVARDGDFGLAAGRSCPWRWVDPAGEGAHSLDASGALVVTAPRKAAGRMEPPECPHLLRPISGAFAVETVLTGLDRAAGGLLLWAAEDEYAFVGKWFYANRDIRTVTRVGGDPGMVGRGVLPTGDVLHLRLEYDGGCVRTLCSEDGEAWLLSAEAPFPASRPLHIGLYADGDYDVESVSTTFTDFRVFRPESDPV